MSQKISKYDLNFEKQPVILYADVIEKKELLFRFCHKRCVPIYAVTSNELVVWQGTSLTDACEEFNKLV